MNGGLGWLLLAPQTLSGPSGRGLALLVEATLKGTFLLLCALVLTLALRRASAATRHLIWKLALGAMLALPVLSLTLPAWKLPMLPLSPSGAGGGPAMAAEDFAAVLRNPRVHRDHTERLEPALAGTTGHPASAAWILSLWALGAMLWTARIALGEARVRRLARRSRPFDTRQAKSILENVCRCLRVSRAVELRTSAETATPFTRGALRPAVLLPAEARQWSRKQLEWVLAHELAHIARNDYLTQIAAQLACALFWFHPLVWLAAFEMRKERERACDDTVLNFGHPAADYAEFLLALTRGLRRLDGAWLTSVAMARSSQLEVRMKALLDPKLDHRPLAARRALLAAALAAVLLLPVAAIRATAKNSAGNISGTVHDPSGAVIPGANVTLFNMEQKYKVVARSGEDGAFAFPAMPAGLYRLEISSPGFAYTKSADLELKPSGDLHQDVTLDIGELTQEFVVHGHKPAENPAATPAAPRRIRVGGNVEAAKLLHQQEPEYPAGAQKQGIEGTVILRAVIGTSGQVLSLSPDNDADAQLASAAMNAVRQWQYQPTLLDGEPVEVVTTITVVFRLDE